MVQHLSMFDYLCVGGSVEGGQVCEYVDHLHEHFVDPVVVKGARYQVPRLPGYGCEMKAESIEGYEYPGGHVWKQLEKEGKVTLPK